MTELKMCELEVIDGGISGIAVAGGVLIGIELIKAGYDFGKWCQGAWNKYF